LRHGLEIARLATRHSATAIATTWCGELAVNRHLTHLAADFWRRVFEKGPAASVEKTVATNNE